MECQICFETFDSKYFVPKMLVNCGHSFCKICLERLINKKTSVTCPVCREPTRLTTFQDKDLTLPTNYSLVEIIDKSKNLEQTKGVLERYKYFDEKSYNKINTTVHRNFDPKVLTLKKIVNDDFIYVEEFENQQNTSIFSSFKQRNRRYNFNRNSVFSYLFNEYSMTIFMFRKASKCLHEHSCLENILKRVFYALCIGYFSQYPLRRLFNLPEFKPYINNFGNSESLIKYCQFGVAGLMTIGKVLRCLIGFYVDEIISIC